MTVFTLARALVVAAAATGAAAAVVVVALMAAPAPQQAAATFPDLLALLAAVALAGCAAWGWLSVVVVLLEAVTGRVGRVRAVPVTVRRVVLLLCGLSVLAALAPPATAAADPPPIGGATVAGLPFPDRASGPAAAPRPAPRPAPASTYTVRAGDSLWSIARANRPDAADDVLARDVARLFAANRAVIGTDADLLRPGQRLVTPRPPR